MNVFVKKSEEASILAFCSSNAEVAANYIDTKDLGEILLRVTAILRNAVGMNQYSLDVVEDFEMISWASQTQGNFIWLASFAQHLHLNYFSAFGYFADCFDELNLITCAFDKLPIGDFTTIPNLAVSKKHEIDFRHFSNPYTAYSLLLNKLASKAG